MKAIDVLTKYEPCGEACEWMGELSPSEAWETCPRGDWMLWASVRLGIDRRLMVLAACDCAETTLQFVPEGEKRHRNAIETARRWARGEASPDEVRAAADAAYAAYVKAIHIPYTDSSRAVAIYTADAAFAAIDSIVGEDEEATSFAAYSAVYAIDVSHTSTRAAARKRCADLVRARIPFKTIEAALEEQ